MQTLIKILTLFLFFTLPLFFSHIFDFILNKNIFLVDWNYEFSKVIFFNIFSGLIIILFFIKNIFSKSPSHVGEGLGVRFYIFYFLILISTYFSVSPFISFFWNTAKAHSFLMINNLFWIFIVLSNFSENFRKKILKTIIFSSIFVSIFAIKEYFFPSYNYWDLSNRALWSFWHPNYLALFILLIIPILYNSLLVHRIPPFGYNFLPFGQKGVGYKKYFLSFILLLTIFTLFITKSALAILIFIFYNFYFFYSNNFIPSLIKGVRGNFWKYFSILPSLRLKGRVGDGLIINKNFLKIIIPFILILSPILIYNLYPEKLSSFISRFFIWETTLKIIFSDIKTIFIWNWAETLPYFFSDFKNINLYIFENFWFSSDRPHNLFLNFFYHFWIFSLFFIFYFLYKIFKNKSSLSEKNTQNIYIEAITIFFIFTFFNFSNIATYLILIFTISSYFFSPFSIKGSTPERREGLLKISFLIVITIFSIINLYYSPKFYLSENKTYIWQYKEASEIFEYNPNNFYSLNKSEKGLEIEKIKSKNYYLSKITNTKNLLKTCEELVKKHSSAENYFLCWDYLEKFWYKKESKEFYKKWLKKLPDLWNKDSKYYDNFFIKNFIDWKRFFSEKYGDIREILEKVVD